MPNEVSLRMFEVETFPRGTEFVVPMERRGENSEPGLTVFKIVSKGPEPTVNLTQTEEGTVLGSDMRFLGSVATKDALESDPSNAIITGKIVGGYRLAVANLVTREVVLIPGLVDRQLGVTTRQ